MSDFLEPIGNEEAILQNILGANNELLPPMSRNEKILLDILGEDYPIDPPMSRIEALLIALKEKIEHDTPSGKITITENGNDIDIAQYATADVAVPTADLGTKSITANGTYAASEDNLDGYDEVIVNVPDASFAVLKGLCEDNVEEITLPNGITRLDRGTICYKIKLSRLFLPDSLTEIDSYAFDGTSLDYLFIPSGIQTIKSNAYIGAFASNGVCDVGNLDNYLLAICPANADNYVEYNNDWKLYENGVEVKSVIMPTSITKMYDTFSRCKSITSVILPPNLTLLGKRALRICPGLTTVKIPSTVTKIDNNAFDSSENLVQIDCTELTATNGTVNTSLGTNVFLSTTCTLLFADEATKNAYAAATNWSTYASRMTYVGA